MTTPTWAGTGWDGVRTSRVRLRERASSIIAWYTGKSSVTRAIFLFL
ncbi:MAG TPA: hypothetical protein VJJ51_13915 [Candidatus Methanoperedens sp.]|nr:hypothetical protein [Candidatus Methanoperedens sp.]HLB72133.1 hypothetical protein [Candidatus Methanoperedens sp.]